ncbi:hypothetical protein BDM02DRAFT_3129101 [Thelephora ganbajun]|uniref:Uncharacterized protein n=1 Tax=Thelephora ganbajun TaxID=370292 RepID=A0ACB6ZG79_THEGA|nr:hypothetical protein BDM02DRAFT_3129101 [Thelephora ganbajun]
MSSPVPEDSIPSTPAAPDNNVLIGTPGENNAPLQPPTTPPGTSPRDSLTPSAAAHLVPETEKSFERSLEENIADQPERRSLFRRPIFWFAVVAAVVVVVLAVVLPVHFTTAKPKNNTSSGGGGNPNGNGGNNGGNNTGTPKPPKGLTTGGDGSTIITENGTEFTYHNPFGGFFEIAGVWDPKNPFNDNAQPNSWTPPLNTTWKWGVHKLYGVNLGGWFVLEPFISPALFQRYADAGAIDEWTISTLMAADTTNGGLAQLEHHYDTFITEQDFAEIAGAGLNWVRMPIPWWAIDVWDGEPFLPRKCWKYILRAFQWARKYGIRVAIDLHVAPGSQNAPLWSYKLGLDNGWMPKDPRQSQGKCAALGVTAARPFDGKYLPWQTGGDGAGNIPPSVTSSFPWPPATISNARVVPSLLPQYTPAGSISTLPPPTFTATDVKINGWYDSGDTAPAPTPIPGCPYPNAWGAPDDLALPIAGCTPGGR